MRRRAVLAVITVLCLSSMSSIAQAQTKASGAKAKAQPAAQIATVPDPVPVNSAASPEARALLKYLYSISGRATLTGQHNYPNHSSRWTDRAYDLTAKYPALYGEDFGFSAGDDKDSVEARPAMIEEVKRQYRNGAVVTLTWHAVRPTDDEPVTFMGSVRKELTDFEWNELLTPGTDLNKRWCAQVDAIAGYLKQLRDAHVPVLFRPYHEMNGNWFWWGFRPGAHGSAALYRQIYDRFVNYHKLNNLIWLWNVNAPSMNAGPFADYFPRSEYVDVLTVDNYGEFKQQYYDDVLALAKGKPVALGEVGALPEVEVFKTQPRWTYFMTWSEWIDEATPVEKVRQVYALATMVGRDDARLSGPMAEIRKLSAEAETEPVTAEATVAAKALLTRLHSVSGKSLLAGQQNDTQALTRATEHAVAVTTKAPAIYAAELAVSKESGLDVGATRQAVVDQAKGQFQKGAIVSLSWKPGRPTEDEPASVEKSVRGQLTDFEWNQLLTPGTRLHERWGAQVDAVAGALKQLQDAGVAVLWRPYPEMNGKSFWWSGRKGKQGSSALYRQLFERLVNKDGVRNLIWVWDAVPGSEGTEYSEFFPGLLYVDSIGISTNEVGWAMDRPVKLMALGKPIGLEVSGKVPDAATLERQPNWSWILLTSGQVNDGVLKTLFANPRVTAFAVGAETPAASSAK